MTFLSSPQMSTHYYIHHDDFNLPASVQMTDQYPSDIKRIWSTCRGSHMFRKRFYFFSENYGKVYKFGSDPMSYHERNDTHGYCLVDDMNKRCSFCFNDYLIKCTSNMNKIELPKKYRLAVFIFEFFAESLVNDPATQNTSNDFSTNFFPRCHTIKMSSNFYELEDICNFVDISEIHSIEDVIDSINEFFDDELVVEVDIDEVMNGLLYYFNGDLLDYHGNKAA